MTIVATVSQTKNRVILLYGIRLYLFMFNVTKNVRTNVNEGDACAMVSLCAPAEHINTTCVTWGQWSCSGSSTSYQYMCNMGLWSCSG